MPNNISECLYSADLRSQLECRWRWIWRCELFLLKEKHSFLLLARTVTKKAVEVKECELAQVVTGLADVRSNDAAINDKSLVGTQMTVVHNINLPNEDEVVTLA